MGMTRLAEPFYVVFALDILGAPIPMVGLYLSARTLASILSNLGWKRVEQTRNRFFVVKLAALLTMLTPLLAALLPWLMRLLGFTVAQYGLLPAYLFIGVFLLAGSSESGRSIGLSALLLDIAPDEERTSYIGLVSTALGFVSLLPILSGAIIDKLGFEPIFFLVTGLLTLGYFIILKWNYEAESN